MTAPTAVDFQASVAADNRRVAPRTFLMLAATAHCSAGVLAVRIRNVSETGALIEGDGLPGADEPIKLSRGETAIDGVIAWVAGIRRGVHFSQPVAVETWRTGRPAVPPAKPVRGEVRQPTAPPARTTAPAAAPPTDERWVSQLDSRISEEIAFVQRMIEALGDNLVTDHAILHRHAQALQNIDLASQILGHLARVMATSERADAVRQIGMDDLRARLSRYRKVG